MRGFAARGGEVVLCHDPARHIPGPVCGDAVMNIGLIWAFASYLRIRCFPHVIRDRPALQRWQQRRVARWLACDVPRVDAFRAPAHRLEDLPVMDKAHLMADFSRYNTARITNDQGWAAFAGSRQIGDLIVGASTGTSGNRGLFVISQRERLSLAWGDPGQGRSGLLVAPQPDCGALAAGYAAL